MLSDFRLLLIIFIGVFLRFYKLDWGSGYFFHPDEYHISGAVGRLDFPSQMNPQLFSYGSLTVYLIYFTRLLLGALDERFLNISPILIGRFYSALFSSLTVILVYRLGRQFLNKEASLFGASLGALMPGLIQQAHFATPESNLTFWLFLTLFFWVRYGQKKKIIFLYSSAISLGLALGTKIVALIFWPILVLLPIIHYRLKLFTNPVRLIKLLIFPSLIVVIVFWIVFPYAFFDWEDFRSSMNYEIGVGRGQPIVFYTRQFINTRPVLFQFQKILPYALGPGVLILGTLGFFILLKDRRFLILSFVFAVYFFSQAFLFAKWTRFIVPSFPFFVLFSVYLLSKIKKKFFITVAYGLILINWLWGLIFFTIFLRPDVRITATQWVNDNLPADGFILTEAGNMLEVPLRNHQKNAFDFYHLEEKKSLQEQLPELLVKTDYFIVQSRRIFINHQRLPEEFPLTARFYNLLFSGKLGFKKIKEFSSYPLIPDELAEETWSVFDHPVIRIYQKVESLQSLDYERILSKN